MGRFFVRAFDERFLLHVGATSFGKMLVMLVILLILGMASKLFVLIMLLWLLFL